MPQAAWLIAGPPGSGKSTFIRQEAVRRGCRLLHWNARLDRSLRDGRDRLHVQVRSKEPSILWIEGIEDLTQEAQAFLRRILETATSQVLCFLESTEPWRIAAPVLSRCIFREIKQQNRPKETKQYGNIRDLVQAWKNGENPVIALETMLHSQEVSLDLCLETYRKWGNGMSPWILLAWLYAEKEARSRESGNDRTSI